MTDDFHSLFERFIEESKYLKNLSPKTIISYKQAWAVYSRWLGAASNETDLKRATKDAVMGLGTGSQDQDHQHQHLRARHQLLLGLASSRGPHRRAYCGDEGKR